MYNEFLTWSDAQISACTSKQKLLAADNRQDEASFMQIRANVYGIFRAVWTAVKGDLTVFMTKLTSIPAVWEQSLQLARQHGDDHKACIEQIKLETADDIRRHIKEAIPDD